MLQIMIHGSMIMPASTRLSCGSASGAVGNFRRGLEVGVGSGRFAIPLGIDGVLIHLKDLAVMAKHRGIEVIRGEAEHLPYRAGSFDLVLMMTVICFLDDIHAAFHEAHRVLGRDGTLVAGFIEEGGKIVQKYRNEPVKGRFLPFATFRTMNEVSGFFKEKQDLRIFQFFEENMVSA